MSATRVFDNPVVSYLTTLIAMGVVATLLHLLISWTGLNDLGALLVFAAPISAYLAYCTHHDLRAQRRAAIWIYATSCSVITAAAVLVYLIS